MLIIAHREPSPTIEARFDCELCKFLSAHVYQYNYHRVEQIFEQRSWSIETSPSPLPRSLANILLGQLPPKLCHQLCGLLLDSTSTCELNWKRVSKVAKLRHISQNYHGRNDVYEISADSWLSKLCMALLHRLWVRLDDSELTVTQCNTSGYIPT